MNNEVNRLSTNALGSVGLRGLELSLGGDVCPPLGGSQHPQALCCPCPVGLDTCMGKHHAEGVR